MKHTTVVTVLLAALAIAAPAPIDAQGAPQAPTPAPVNVAGEWTITLETRRQAVFRGAMDQKGTRLSGYMGDEAAEYPLTGSVDGDSVKISWTLEQFGEKIVITVTGKFEKEAIAGKAALGTLDTVEAYAQRTAK